MFDHTFPKLQITRSDIRPHIKWTVCLVIAYGHLNLPQGFVWICMGKHTHFITPIPTPDGVIWEVRNIQTTRSTQRAQTSLAEADHYSLIFPNVIMLSLGGERLTPKVSDHYLHHDLGILLLLWCSFTHLRIPRSPPKFNQFFIVLPRTPP